MRHSVARKVTRRVSLLLLAAMIILFIGAFHLVSNVISGANEKYELTILGIYTDLLVEESEMQGIPIDAEHTDSVIRYGEYICDWYGVDYVYIYVPDVENDTVTYIAAAYTDGMVDEAPDDNMIGRTAEHKLTSEELAVWNGEQYVGHITSNNGYGHEVSTILRIEDSFGNRAIAGVDIAYSDIIRQVVTAFSILALIIIAVLLGIYFAVYLIIRKRVSRPAQLISGSMVDFITDGKRSGVKLDDSGSDEFSMIAGAFNSMTDNIDSYLENISDLTRRQEHQKTELDIASRIQRGFLPKEQLNGYGYEVRAKMLPANDVGGDLYDFIPLDSHRIFTVIADVSGKGISAAMFMSVTLTLIRQYARMELSPGEVLRRVNAILSEKNAALMFATAFVGIYDSDTRRFTYANAGHNLPYVVGDRLSVLDGASGTPLGLFEDGDYPETTVQLGFNDTLFLYTDGVDEAVNTERCFYGTERLESELISCGRRHDADIIARVEDSVRTFSGDVEQHDDITMLTLSVKNAGVLLLDADIKELTRIKAAILALSMPRTELLKLCLAAEECFVNICSYGFADGVPKDEKVCFSLKVSDKIEMKFEDEGQPFNPLKQVISPEDYDMDTQIGGLGRLISFSIADDVSYEYRDGKNILTLTKKVEEENR